MRLQSEIWPKPLWGIQWQWGSQKYDLSHDEGQLGNRLGLILDSKSPLSWCLCGFAFVVRSKALPFPHAQSYPAFWWPAELDLRLDHSSAFLTALYTSPRHHAAAQSVDAERSSKEAWHKFFRLILSLSDDTGENHQEPGLWCCKMNQHFEIVQRNWHE